MPSGSAHPADGAAGEVPGVSVQGGRMLMLSGAPGAGKTAVLTDLRRLLPGVVVIDIDEFLAAASELAGTDLTQTAAAERWPAYNDLCLGFAAAVLRAGHDLLLLSPLMPAEMKRSTKAPLLGLVRWAVLDCTDTTRRFRLVARLNDAQVEDALSDAAVLRALDLPLLSSDGVTVESTAQAVAEWASNALYVDTTASGTAEGKLAVLRAAARYEFPAPDIDPMVEETQRGYLR